MQTVSLEVAQANLPKLLKDLGQQEQLIITEHGQPLATVTKSQPAPARPRVFGCCRRMFKDADGWDAPDEDFRAYME
jgi:antitoxin (DNA-binding transcriptional repressor) of toxin-antitoxin stability system